MIESLFKVKKINNLVKKSRGLSLTYDPYDIRLYLFGSFSLVKTPLAGTDGGTRQDNLFSEISRTNDIS